MDEVCLSQQQQAGARCQMCGAGACVSSRHHWMRGSAWASAWVQTTAACRTEPRGDVGNALIAHAQWPSGDHHLWYQGMQMRERPPVLAEDT
jgi:hypothetical protein